MKTITKITCLQREMHLFDLKVDCTHWSCHCYWERGTKGKSWRTMEKSCWSILVMDESVSETFPDDVMVRVHFVSELFLFFSGPGSAGCESQRELGYSQSLYALLLCLYGTLWRCRVEHVKIRYYSQAHSTSGLSLLIQRLSVFVFECLHFTCSWQPLQSKYWLLQDERISIWQKFA